MIDHGFFLSSFYLGFYIIEKDKKSDLNMTLSKLIFASRYLIFLFILFLSCSRAYYVRNDFKFPDPVDTYNKQIELQVKKRYIIDGVSADNQFEGARLNDFQKIDNNTFQALIKPENTPVNESPWFSFRISSQTARKIYLKLKYQNSKHRYVPKLSKDGRLWVPIDTSLIKRTDNDSSVIFLLDLLPSFTYVSAQEIINSSDIEMWIDSLKSNDLTSDFQTIGKTPLGKALNFFRIGKGSSKGKKVISILTRQHPPEISGYLAFKSFVEEIIITNEFTDEFFDKYEIWVFPNLNPDGVDLGHWRHNYNGIDLNRDWSYYRQPEIDITTRFIVERSKKNKNKIMLSLDFHSTTQDIYYVFDDTFNSKLKKFTREWTNIIDKGVFPYKTLFSPEPLGKPYSKTWFYMQFKAESLTYEVGDEVNREIIKKKAQIAATSMMKLLSE